MKTRTGTAWIACAALLAAGCFSMEHRLPPRTYFGKLPPRAGEQSFPFAQLQHKNYWMSGLFPWSGWSANAMLTPLASEGRVEQLAIETSFNEFDVAVSILPGLVYGYYLWAPRSIRVSGQIVRSNR